MLSFGFGEEVISWNIINDQHQRQGESGSFYAEKMVYFDYRHFVFYIVATQQVNRLGILSVACLSKLGSKNFGKNASFILKLSTKTCHGEFFTYNLNKREIFRAKSFFVTLKKLKM